MEKELEKLNQIREVLGSFVFSIRKKVIANRMPPVFTQEKLLTIGKHLVKIHLAGTMSLKGVQEISLFYEESVITIREIVRHTYLVVFYDPSIKPNQLTISLNMTIGELKNKIGGSIRTGAPKNNSEKVPPQKPIQLKKPAGTRKDRFLESELQKLEDEEKTTMIDPDTLISSGPMAGVLQEMQNALNKVIGPFSEYIFYHALQEWIATDQPHFSSLPSLVEILRREINDSEKFEMYNKRITPYIWIDN